ncbi:unnamed protein product [Porites lobata]|uniref:UPAR/Ly6 domain-containing protein n=1 Tax=Porites lobata TaxID=104759 RepID=A0ABN8QWQ5_9CNID|nr:unnamed protein product [Porites lobata]
MVRSGASVRVRMSEMSPPCTSTDHIRSLERSNDEDLLQLENRTALKLGLQQLNLQLVDVKHTGTCIQNVNRHAIKCYQCFSTKSWDDCVPGNDTACPFPRLNSCLKVKLEGEKEGKNINFFVKSCDVKSNCYKDNCKSVAQNRNMKFKDCDVNCCDTDLCNGAKATMVSSFLFLACALVANFR